MEQSNNKLNVKDKVEYLTMICTIIDYREYSDGKREYKLDLGLGNNPEWVKQDEVVKYSDILPDHVKAWLRVVIRPYRDKVYKIWITSTNSLLIDLNDFKDLTLPIYNENDFSKMKPLHNYTLEDLGL